MSAVTTVIFDMFNTIAQDSPEHWRQTFAAIIAAQQLDTTPEALRHAWDYGAGSFREQRTTPGASFISYLDGWAGAFATAFARLNLAGDARAAAQQSIANLGERPLFSDSPPALAQIGQNRRLAVISNADDSYLNPVVARIPADFAAVISSEALRCYKPDRRLFDAALTRLQVHPSQCAYVGDKQFEDVLGAHGAGMAAIWINRAGAPLNPDLPTPDGEIQNLLQLPAVLQSL